MGRHVAAPSLGEGPAYGTVQECEGNTPHAEGRGATLRDSRAKGSLEGNPEAARPAE